MKPLSLLAAAFLAVGCASSNENRTETTTTMTRSDTVTHRPDGITEHSTPTPYAGLASDRATAHGGRMVFEDRVPSTAAEIGEPTTLKDGNRRADAAVIARPVSDGQVWVVERDTGRIVYGGHLRKGQSLVVNLSRNELSLDGRPISTARIDGSRPYQIFFLPG